MDADGKAIEHLDTLQLVANPKNSAPVDRAEHSARQPERNVLSGEDLL